MQLRCQSAVDDDLAQGVNGAHCRAPPATAGTAALHRARLARWRTPTMVFRLVFLVVLLLLLAAGVVARPSIGIGEWTALRQFFNDTGGAAGAWHNATGWNVSDYESAPDPCDGVSWFGITDRFYHGMSFGERVDTCTNATPGRRQVQHLQLFAFQPLLVSITYVAECIVEVLCEGVAKRWRRGGKVVALADSAEA